MCFMRGCAPVHHWPYISVNFFVVCLLELEWPFMHKSFLYYFSFYSNNLLHPRTSRQLPDRSKTLFYKTKSSPRCEP